jgi:hypothetical protein
MKKIGRNISSQNSTDDQQKQQNAATNQRFDSETKQRFDHDQTPMRLVPDHSPNVTFSPSLSGSKPFANIFLSNDNSNFEVRNTQGNLITNIPIGQSSGLSFEGRT